MSESFSEELLEQCRKVPLHHVVGLTNVTRRVNILSPFRKEKTPSCSLFPNNGRYNGGFKCYSSGEQGNSIDFLMKLGATLPEAVNELRKYL